MAGVFTHQVDEMVCDFGRAIYHGKEPDETPCGEGLVVVQRKLFSLVTTPWRFAYVNLIVEEDYPVGAWADELDDDTKAYLDVRAMADPVPLSDDHPPTQHRTVSRSRPAGRGRPFSRPWPDYSLCGLL